MLVVAPAMFRIPDSPSEEEAWHPLLSPELAKNAGELCIGQ